MAKKDTKIGGVDIPSGTKLVVGLAAANRDPRRWPESQDFKFNREKMNQHVAFGRGLHTCIGAPLARAEVRVILTELLAKTSDISLSEEHHGKPGESNLKYEPSYIIRGLDKLHIKLTPA